MKRLWTLLLVLLLLLPAGCARPEDVPAPSPTPAPEEPVEYTPLLTVSAGGTSVEPLAHELFANYWSEEGGGMVNYDAAPLDKTPGVTYDLPTLTYGPDYAVQPRERADLNAVCVYTPDWGEVLPRQEDLDAVKTLAPGEYIVSYSATLHGSGEHDELSGYECLFRLVVPEA